MVTSGASAVHDDDRLSPAQAPAAGVCTVISQEYLGLRCRHVDIAFDAFDEPGAVAHVAAEALADSGERAVAYRAGLRFARGFRPQRLEATAADARRLRQNGVYLITGGLGAIGLTLAEHLARTVGARLALLGRSEGSAQARARVEALRAAGTTVLVLQADVADAGQMAQALAAIDNTFGTLDGIVYAAGNLDPGGFSPLEDMNSERCAGHFAAKVKGLAVLEEILGNRSLDFCIIVSSLSSVLGGLGDFAETAANCYLDAFTHDHNRRRPVQWTAVNWEAWKLLKTGAAAQLGGTLSHLEIGHLQGQQAFVRALASPAPQLVISTGDLDTRIRQWVDLELLRRPALPSVISATGDLIDRIAALWKEILGIAEIGLHDNFFDLGGTSLVGLQLVRGSARSTTANLPAVALFEAPTIRALARYLG